MLYIHCHLGGSQVQSTNLMLLYVENMVEGNSTLTKTHAALTTFNTEVTTHPNEDKSYWHSGWILLGQLGAIVFSQMRSCDHDSSQFLFIF